MKATIIDPSGEIKATELTQAPPLDQLQGWVGGLIEIVPFWDKYGDEDCIVFCNEEGKLDGLPPNPVAQQEWEKVVPRARGIDHLVGTIVILTGDKSELARL